jgi:hypothetical protein
MNKNWLIRTKNNHILGPVSREKVKELIGNGTIKGDDEICSGNGYWIYIREEELLSKYIMGGVTQGFNPVQEAQPSEAKKDEILEVPEPSTLPEKSDLEYPDSNNFKEASAARTDQEDLNLNEDSTISEDEVEDLSLADNVETPQEVESNVVSIKKNSNLKNEVTLKAAKQRKVKETSNKTKNVKSSKLSINLLYIIAIIFLLIAAISYKFKSTILNEINKRVSISVFSEAIAQDSTGDLNSKKKNG